jgi:hypothetical protein
MPVRRPPRCNFAVEAAAGCLDHDTASLLCAHILRRAPFADRTGALILHDKSSIRAKAIFESNARPGEVGFHQVTDGLGQGESSGWARPAPSEYMICQSVVGLGFQQFAPGHALALWVGRDTERTAVEGSVTTCWTSYWPSSRYPGRIVCEGAVPSVAESARKDRLRMR